MAASQPLRQIKMFTRNFTKESVFVLVSPELRSPRRGVKSFGTFGVDCIWTNEIKKSCDSCYSLNGQHTNWPIVTPSSNGCFAVVLKKTQLTFPKKVPNPINYIGVIHDFNQSHYLRNVTTLLQIIAYCNCLRKGSGVQTQTHPGPIKPDPTNYEF